MLAWSTIAYGTALSAVLAAALVAVALRPPRRLAVIATAALATGLGAAAAFLEVCPRASGASQPRSRHKIR